MTHRRHRLRCGRRRSRRTLHQIRLTIRRRPAATHAAAEASAKRSDSARPAAPRTAAPRARRRRRHGRLIRIQISRNTMRPIGKPPAPARRRGASRLARPGMLVFRASASRSAIASAPAFSPCPYSPFLEIRRHRLATDVAGEPVRDELLERVADFHADASVLHGKQNQHAVVLAARADAAAAILEHLRRERLDVPRLHGVDGRDHQDIACGLLEAGRQIGDLLSRRGVDHIGEIVDRAGEGGRRRLRYERRRQAHHERDDKQEPGH